MIFINNYYLVCLNKNVVFYVHSNWIIGITHWGIVDLNDYM